MTNFDAIPRSESLNDFSERLRSMRLDRAARLSAAMNEKRSAEALGEARQLAERMGSPIADVLADVSKAKQVEAQRAVTAPSFDRDFPTLAGRIDGDFEFLTMARDDLGNLTSTEGALSWLGRSFDNSLEGIQRSVGARLGRLTGSGPIETAADKQIRREKLQVAAQRDGDNWGADAVNVLTSLGATVAAGAAGFAVAGPAGAYVGATSMSFAMSSGEIYTTLLDEGYTPAEAAPLADGWGAVMAALDLVGAGSVAKAFSKDIGKKLLPKLLSRGVGLETKKTLLLSAVKDYATGVGVESVTEVLQQAAVIAARQQAHTNANRPGAFEADVSGELWDTFVHTFRGMVLVGLPGAGRRVADAHRRSANAQQTMQAHERLEKLEAESMLRTRSPGTRAAFVNDAAHEDMKTVYIRPDKLIETLDQFENDPATAGERERLEATFPGILDRAREAVEDGTDVELPIGDWQAKLATSPLGRALMPHAVFHQDADTFSEREVLQPLEGDFEPAMAEATEKAQADEQFRLLLDDTYDHFYSQASQARRGAAEARAFASMARNVIVSLAKKEGVTLDEYLKAKPLPTVRRVSDPAQVAGPMFEQLREKARDFAARAPKPKRDVREDVRAGTMAFDQIPSDVVPIVWDRGVDQTRSSKGTSTVELKAIGGGEFAFRYDMEPLGSREESGIKTPPIKLEGVLRVGQLGSGRHGADLVKLTTQQEGDFAPQESLNPAVHRLLNTLAQEFENVAGNVELLAPERGFELDRALGFSGVMVSKFDSSFMHGEGRSVPHYELTSALFEEVRELGFVKMKVAGWHDLLNRLVTKGALKQDEVFWSGITDWLDQKHGKVHANEVVAFLRSRLPTVSLMERAKSSEPERDYDDLAMHYDGEYMKWFVFDEDGNQGFASYVHDSFDSEEEAYERASEMAADEADVDLEVRLTEDPDVEDREVFAIFDGDEEFDGNYYETRSEAEDAVWEAQDALRDTWMQDNVRVEMAPLFEIDEVFADELLADLNADLNANDEDAFAHWTIGHYGEDPESNYRELVVTLDGRHIHSPDRHDFGQDENDQALNDNMLLHIRTTDRRTPDGKRVLFVEEIQSDWSQYTEDGEWAIPKVTADVRAQAEGELAKIRKDLDDVVARLRDMRAVYSNTVKAKLEELSGGHRTVTGYDIANRDALIPGIVDRMIAERGLEPGSRSNVIVSNEANDEARDIIYERWDGIRAEAEAPHEGLLNSIARLENREARLRVAMREVNPDGGGTPIAPFVASVGKFELTRDGEVVTDQDGNAVRFGSEEEAQRTASALVVKLASGEFLLDAKKNVRRFKSDKALRDAFKQHGGLPKGATAVKFGDSVQPADPSSDRASVMRLAAKRVTLLAAQEGYHSVAFINGAQTSDIYSVGGVLDKLTVTPLPDGTRYLMLEPRGGDGPQQWTVNAQGEVIKAPDSRYHGPLSDSFGKAMSEDIMSQTHIKSYEGRGELTFGYEGYRQIYEEMLGKELKDIAKKAGTKVGMVPVATGMENYSILEPARRPEVVEISDEEALAMLAEAEANNYLTTGVRLAAADGDGFFHVRDAQHMETLRAVDKAGQAAYIKPAQPEKRADHSKQLGFEITDAFREKLREGMPLFQNEEGAARGGYAPQLREILLSDKSPEDGGANSSTLFHELSHFYLEEISAISVKTGPDSAAWKDLATVLKWKNISVAEWHSMNTDERRQIHEAFARNFERWLYEGVAPSPDMASLFSRIRAWIVAVYTDVIQKLNRAYKDEFHEDLPGLTDEVRQVFGRMVSTEAEVRAAFEAQAFEALFQTEEEFVAAGGKAADYQKTLDKHGEVEAAAIDELTRKRLRSMELASGATQGVLKTLQRRHTKRRRELRAEVEPEVRNRPVERVRHWLRNGEHLDEDGELASVVGKNTSHKLNRGKVTGTVDARTLKRLEEAKALTNTGLDPEVVAPMFGYESGDQLLEAVSEQPDLGAAVKAELDKRMHAEHPELTDPKLIREQIAEATHNKVRRQIVAQELRLLEKSDQPVRMLRRAAKNVARQRLLTMDVKDVSVARFTIGSRRARKAASIAIREGDLTAARAAKRQEMMAEAMAEVAGEFRKELDRNTKMWAKAFRKDEKMGKVRDMNVVHILRSLLATLDAGRAQTDPNKHLAEVSEYAPHLVDEWTPRLNRARQFLAEKGLQVPQGEKARFEFLTVDEFREFASLAEGLWNQSKKVRQLELDGKRVLRENAVEQAKLDLEAALTEKGQRGLRGAITRREDAHGHVLDYFTSLVRIEHVFRQLGGIFPKLFQRVKDAGNAKRKEMRAEALDIEAEIKKLDLGKREKITAKELDGYVFGQGVVAKAEILGMALHYYSHGAESRGVSNRDKLLRGYEWDAAQVEQFLDRMQTEGVLTAADFAWIQSVYDRNGKYLKRVQKAHYAAYGFYMKTMKTEPFQTKFGEFDGGYLPARADPKKVSRVATFDQDKLADTYSSWPVYDKSFTMERSAKVKHLLDFNIGNQSLHVESVLNFIHMHPAVRDVSQVLNNFEVQEIMNRDIGHKFVNSVIEPWLKRSAEQSLGPPADSPMTKLVSWLARGAQMGTMFLNTVNALQNYTGFGPILRETKPGYVGRSSMRYLQGPRTMGREIAKLSPEMAERMERQVFEITQETNSVLLGDGRVKKLGKWFNRNTYIMQTATQHSVDVIGWDAHYNQVLAQQLKGGATAQQATKVAVQEADSLIRRTQMSGAPEDISRFESLGGMWKAVAPFKSWFINWFNYTASRTRQDLRKEGVERVSALMATYASTVLVPGVIATLIADGLRGDFEDEENDGWGDDVVGLIGRAHLDLFTGPLPLVGPGVRIAANTFFDDNVWNTRMPVSLYAKLVEKLAHAPSKLASGELVDVFDAIYALGAVLHVPLEGFGKLGKLTGVIGDDR